MTTPYDSRGMDPENREFPEELNDERNAAPTGTGPQGAGSSPLGARSGPLEDGMTLPGAGATPPGAGATPPGAGASFDELALRRLMQDAVKGLKPAPDALDHLRHAIERGFCHECRRHIRDVARATHQLDVVDQCDQREDAG